MIKVEKKIICSICKNEADSEMDAESIKETGACMFCYHENQEARNPAHPDDKGRS